MRQCIPLYLVFHGISVRVHAPEETFIDMLRFDFSRFISDPRDTADISIEVTTDQYPALPEIEETAHSPSFVAYDDGERRYVDYYGRALVVIDYRLEHARLYCEDLDFAYEKLYLLILSRVGELLDRKGLHRVHSLGMSFGNKTALFLLPMRAGKSTLALAFLEFPEVKLFSEDTPLVDHKGRVHPFPMRLGIREGESFPVTAPEHVRRFVRSELGPKVLISAEHFSSRIAVAPSPVSVLFSGKWTRAAQPSIRPMSRVRTLFLLFRDCVFGLGLPQVVEYFLRTPVLDVIQKTPIALSRAWACLRLVAAADCREVLLCPDRKKNAEVLYRFLCE